MSVESTASLQPTMRRRAGLAIALAATILIAHKVVAADAAPRRLEAPPFPEADKQVGGANGVFHLTTSDKETLVVARVGRLDRWIWKSGKFLGTQYKRPHGERTVMNGGRYVADRVVGDERFTVWNTNTSTHLGWFPDWRSLETASALSPDGQRLAWAMDDGIIRIQDTREAHWSAIPREERGGPATAGEPKLLEGFTDLVTLLAFSADGKLLASVGLEPKVLIWEVDAGKVVDKFAQDAAVTAICFAPDGKSLVIASDDNVVRHRKLEGEQLAELRLTSPQRAFAFSPDGKFLFAGSESGTLRQIGLDDFQVKATGGVGGHSSAIRTIRFSPSGARIFTGGDDSAAVVHDAATLKPIRMSPGQRTPVICLLPFDDDRALLGPNSALWNTTDGSAPSYGTGLDLRDLGRSPDGKRVVGLARHGRNIIATSAAPIVAPGDTTPIDATYVVARNTEGFTLCDVSPDGRMLAISSSNRDELKLYDLETRKILQHIAGPVWWFKFLPDSKRIVVYGRDWSLWDSAAGKRLANFREGVTETPNSWMHKSVVLSADGSRIALSAHDTDKGRTNITVLDVNTALPLASFSDPRAWQRLVQFSADGRLLLSMAYANTAATLWEIASGEAVYQLPEHGKYFKTCVLLNDDRTLATGCDDGTVALHEIAFQSSAGTDSEDHLPDEKPTREIELARAWAVIVENEARPAWVAIDRLIAAKDDGVALVGTRVGSHLPPLVTVDQVRQWIADLSAADKRAATSTLLIKNRDVAWDELQTALRGTPSAAVRGRLQLVVAAKPNSRNTLIVERAVAVLERAATAEAKRALDRLVERGQPTRRIAEQALARIRAAETAASAPAPPENAYADMRTTSCGWTLGRGVALRLESVEMGGPAHAAKLRSGDVLLRINDQPVRTIASVYDILGQIKVGDTIRVAYRRTGRTEVTNVVVRASK